MEPADTVTQIQVSPSPSYGRSFTALELAYFVAPSAAFLPLWSSGVSFFLYQVDFTGVIGHSVTIREETSLAPATAVDALVVQLLEPVELSFEAVDFIVLFIL